MQREIPKWIQRLCNCSGWEFSSALGPGRDWLCLFLPVLSWGGSCVPPHQTGETGRGGMVWRQLGQFLCFTAVTAGTVPAHLSRCTPSDNSSPWFPLGSSSGDTKTNCPALLILNTRRCKSHVTFSFRNCDLFSEWLTSFRDRNTLPSSVLFQITVRGKDWATLLCFCWGVKRRNSLHVIVKLKVQKVLFLLISNIKLVL